MTTYIIRYYYYGWCESFIKGNFESPRKALSLWVSTIYGNGFKGRIIDPHIVRIIDGN